MCGRFGFFELSFFIEQLRQLEIPFEEVPGFGYRQSWNIVPGSQIVTLLGDHECALLSLAQWGLIPHWASSLPKIRPINARADSLASKPFFRHMLNHKHCLIPASGFYEWNTDGSYGKRAWYIHRKDGKPMVLAGLWDEWQKPDPDAVPVTSCTIITTGANRQMKPVHDRMPVILEPEDWSGWLESGNPAAPGLLNPPKEGILDLYPVSARVNNPFNNDQGCIKALEKQE